MYVSAPADPSPPSTSNFIPELPRFIEPEVHFVGYGEEEDCWVGTLIK